MLTCFWISFCLKIIFLTLLLQHKATLFPVQTRLICNVKLFAQPCYRIRLMTKALSYTMRWFSCPVEHSRAADVNRFLVIIICRQCLHKAEKDTTVQWIKAIKDHSVWCTATSHHENVTGGLFKKDKWWLAILCRKGYWETTTTNKEHF